MVIEEVCKECQNTNGEHKPGCSRGKTMSKTTPDEVDARQAARDQSVAELSQRQYTEAQHREFYRVGFNAGFDAGVLFAQGQWKEIRSADDLPKEEKVYWVTLKSEAYVVKRWMTHIFREEWLSHYAAWMPMEVAPAPYQPAEVKTDD